MASKNRSAVLDKPKSTPSGPGGSENPSDPSVSPNTPSETPAVNAPTAQNGDGATDGAAGATSPAVADPIQAEIDRIEKEMTAKIKALRNEKREKLQALVDADASKAVNAFVNKLASDLVTAGRTMSKLTIKAIPSKAVAGTYDIEYTLKAGKTPKPAAPVARVENEDHKILNPA